MEPALPTPYYTPHPIPHTQTIFETLLGQRLDFVGADAGHPFLGLLREQLGEVAWIAKRADLAFLYYAPWVVAWRERLKVRAGVKLPHGPFPAVCAGMAVCVTPETESALALVAAQNTTALMYTTSKVTAELICVFAGQDHRRFGSHDSALHGAGDVRRWPPCQCSGGH